MREVAFLSGDRGHKIDAETEDNGSKIGFFSLTRSSVFSLRIIWTAIFQAIMG